MVTDQYHHPNRAATPPPWLHKTPAPVSVKVPIPANILTHDLRERGGWPVGTHKVRWVEVYDYHSVFFGVDRAQPVKRLPGIKADAARIKKMWRNLAGQWAMPLSYDLEPKPANALADPKNQLTLFGLEKIKVPWFHKPRVLYRDLPPAPSGQQIFPFVFQVPCQCFRCTAQHQGLRGQKNVTHDSVYPAFAALRDALAGKLEYLGSGYSRVAYATKNHVIKIPRTSNGVDCNRREYEAHKRDKRGRLARCRLWKGGVLVMEKVSCVADKSAYLPSWARAFDGIQVGVNRKGRIVAYDYAEDV